MFERALTADLVGHIRILRQKTDGLAFGDVDRAAVRRVFAGDEAEQRGLACAVDADDAEAVALIDRKGYIFENRCRAETERQIGCA